MANKQPLMSVREVTLERREGVGKLRALYNSLLVCRQYAHAHNVSRSMMSQSVVQQRLFIRPGVIFRIHI